jgi:hypothetical protein
MTYNNQHNGFPMSSGLGAPGAGFASRGKGIGLKRLSLATAPKVGSISENPLIGDPAQDRAPTPRTSRSHLLAGLRTQPRTPSILQTSAPQSVSSSIHAPPASAPYHKTTHNTLPYSLSGGNNQYSNSSISLSNVPHTAVGANFPSLVHHQHHHQQHQLSLNPGQQVYTIPEQILAPPPLELDDGDDHLDPDTVRQLHAAETFLIYRQQQLQQLQQQISAMHYGQGNKARQASFPPTPLTPQQFGLYGQPQMIAQPQWVCIPGTALLVAEVAGQPGLLLQYNAQTGEVGYSADPVIAQWLLQSQSAALAASASPPPQTPSYANPYTTTTTSVSAQPAHGVANVVDGRSRSPPKKSPSPDANVTPLPPPSANAFRRGHTRNRSSLVLQPGTGQAVAEGPRSAMIRPVGMPATPMTGTFGPGQNRAGEHPSRQPVGPPAIEELKDKPTTLHEGSKNFCSRQRKRAFNTLVRAGLERRSANTEGSVSTMRPGSGGSLTPVSDNDTSFSLPASSDNDSDVASTGKTSPLIGASEDDHAKLAVEKALAANLAGMTLNAGPGVGMRPIAPGN